MVTMTPGSSSSSQMAMQIIILMHPVKFKLKVCSQKSSKTKEREYTHLPYVFFYKDKQLIYLEFDSYYEV